MCSTVDATLITLWRSSVDAEISILYLIVTVAVSQTLNIVIKIIALKMFILY